MISPWLLSSFIRPHQSNPSSGRSLAAQVFDDALGLRSRDHAGKLLEACLAQAGEAAESPQQLLGGAVAYPGDIHQRRVQRAARAALAGEGDRKPGGFVAGLLGQGQGGRGGLGGSGERRGGEEGRSRGAPYPLKKKEERNEGQV